MTETEQASGSGEWTVASVLRWATADFRRREFENARLDAELLLAHTLGLDRVRLIIEAKRVLELSELAAFRRSIQRRRASEPVAYILGAREFYGFSLCVDPRVLIPRPDTETLVDVALERTRDRYLYGRALDLCTGSGCVAIAFARCRPTWRVSGVDISEAAVNVARNNAERRASLWNMRFLSSDLCAALAPGERFELITANPPYIPSAQIAELTPDIRDFEPHLALDGGDDGLGLVRRIVLEAPARLERGGVLALEVGAGQGDRVHELFLESGLIDVQRRRDYGAHERVISGRKE